MIFIKLADAGMLPANTPLVPLSHAADAGHRMLRPGTLYDRSWLKPNKQIWMRSRQPWLDTLPEIAAFPQQA
jgi:hypothetical protein